MICSPNFAGTGFADQLKYAIEPDIRLYILLAKKTVAQAGQQTESQIIDQLGKNAGVIISCIDPRNPDSSTHSC